jgi:hypothetical protein
MNAEFSELDLTRKSVQNEFERAFFEAFEPLTHNKLIRKLWRWDEANRRLRTAIPYDKQCIFAARDSKGALSTVLALSFDLKITQSGFYGFEVPNEPQNCEALAFFGLGMRSVQPTRQFWNWSRAELQKRGFSTIYATCSPRVMPVYRFVGGTVEQRREIEGETRYFFRLPVEASAGRPAFK